MLFYFSFTVLFKTIENVTAIINKRKLSFIEYQPQNSKLSKIN